VLASGWSFLPYARVSFLPLLVPRNFHYARDGPLFSSDSHGSIRLKARCSVFFSLAPSFLTFPFLAAFENAGLFSGVRVPQDSPFLSGRRVLVL